MQKSVNPWLALAIILFFGSLLGGYFWAGQQWLALDHLGLAKVQSGNEFTLEFGTELYRFNDQGKLLSRLDVKKFGQDRIVGDIDYFANGDLLLALHQQAQTIEQQADVMLRLPNRSVGTGDENLYRCNPSTLACTKFSTLLPSINRSFRLAIDAQDQVYLADTSRHKIWLLDSTGKSLAKKGGFRFPNAIKLYGDELIVADTNHHAIKFLDPTVADYGTERRELVTSLPFGSWFNLQSLWNRITHNRHYWPIDFVQLPNSLWVLVGANSLAQVRVAIYNKQDDFVRELALEPNADPISIIRLGERILLVDMADYRIYQFTLQGQRLADFIPETLAPELKALRQQAQHWRKLQKNCLWVFALLLVLGFAIAIPLQLRDNRREQTRLETLKPAPITDKGVLLLPSVRFKRAMAIGIVGGLVAIACLIYLSLHGNTASSSDKVSLRIGFIVLWGGIYIALLVRLILYFFGQKLIVQKDRLILEMSNGKRYQAPYDKILWDKNVVFIQDKSLVLGRAKGAGIFNYHELEQHLLPRLKPENRLGAWASFIHQTCSSARRRMLTGLALLVLIGFTLLHIYL